jgi:ApaG protein
MNSGFRSGTLHKKTVENLISEVNRVLDGWSLPVDASRHSQPGELTLQDQPRLATLTSGAPLNTPSGMMGGAYPMESENGERFDIKIPTFPLDLPNQDVLLN